MHVLVVGAGIGGLTLASALREHRVTLVERRPEATGIGAGLLLHRRALDALERVGVRVSGRPYPGLSLGLADGRLLPLAAKPGRAVSRPALHAALLRAAAHANLHTSCVVETFDDCDGGVRATLSSGQTLEVDVMVGADGLGSGVRRQLGLPARRRYAGATCWRGITQQESPHDHPVELWGDGLRIGIVPLLEGTYLYLTSTQPAPPERSTPPLARFDHFGCDAPALLRSVPPSDWAHHDLEELDTHSWGHPRVPLLGDAAHGFTPNLGEGAAQAILDAEHLAACLQGAGRYPGARRGRNRRIALASRWMGALGQATGGAARLRDTVLAMFATAPAQA
ncbi:MAG: FAD-dependent monooxygenase [Myxococcales bacterium]|nr:FAD-dependent monooxygenase [Myxococcales bacterium]